LRDSGSQETDPEFERAPKARNHTALDIVQPMKNAFNRLYYPSYDISARAPLLVDMEIDYSSIGGLRESVQETLLPQSQLRSEGAHRPDDVQQILQGNNRNGAVIITKSLENVKYFKFNANDHADMDRFLNRFKPVILGDESIREEITKS